MASTIARATGYDSTRTKTTHRLGSRSAMAEANTWRTFAKVTIWADGSGTVEVKRDGERLHGFAWSSENTNGAPEEVQS